MSKLYERLKNASRQREQSRRGPSRPPALLARALQRAQTERDRLNAPADSPELAVAGVPTPPSGDALVEQAPRERRLASRTLKLAALVAALGAVSYYVMTNPMTDPAPEPVATKPGNSAPVISGEGRRETPLRLERALDLSRKDGAARSSPPGPDRSR